MAGRQVDDEDKILWEYLFKQDDYVIQEFFTAIIGIGALFFAYGSVGNTNPFTQLAIGFIGLGSSLIVWMHMWGSHLQAQAIGEQIGNSPLRQRYNEVMKWRDKTWARRWVYHPVSRLMTYFVALVSMTWALIVVAGLMNATRIQVLVYGWIPTQWFLGVGLIFVVVVFVITMMRKFEDREALNGTSRQPAQSSTP